MTERDYYIHLLAQPNIADITLQPQFTLLAPFQVTCSTCGGSGKVPSPKTGNKIKCKKCEDGKKKRQAWTYKADFMVKYKDGSVEVIDVKGGWVNERFPLVRKMFEYTNGMELVVVKKSKKGWVRK